MTGADVTLPSVVRRPSSVVCRLSSVVGRLPSVMLSSPLGGLIARIRNKPGVGTKNDQISARPRPGRASRHVRCAGADRLCGGYRAIRRLAIRAIPPKAIRLKAYPAQRLSGSPGYPAQGYPGQAACADITRLRALGDASSPSSTTAPPIRRSPTRSSATRTPSPSSRPISTVRWRKRARLGCAGRDFFRCSPASRPNAARSTRRSTRCAAISTA